MNRKKLKAGVERLTAQETLILDVTAAFASIMGRERLTRTAMARQLGVPESHVKRLMEGRNMTLRTLASTLYKLGYRAQIKFVAV